MVKVVRLMVSWYDYEGVTNQEERDEDMVDEMSQEVDSRGEVMRIEMSDLWFSRMSELVDEQVWRVMIERVQPGGWRDIKSHLNCCILKTAGNKVAISQNLWVFQLQNFRGNDVPKIRHRSGHITPSWIRSSATAEKRRVSCACLPRLAMWPCSHWEVYGWEREFYTRCVHLPSASGEI